HAEAMAEAVREAGAVTAVADQRAGGTVHLLALRIQWPTELHGRGLGVVDEIEDLPEFGRRAVAEPGGAGDVGVVPRDAAARVDQHHRSEEHTSELQSRFDLVCRLLLEKKNESTSNRTPPDRQSTRLNSSHVSISYAVSCI